MEAGIQTYHSLRSGWTFRTTCQQVMKALIIFSIQ